MVASNALLLPLLLLSFSFQTSALPSSSSSQSSIAGVLSSLCSIKPLNIILCGSQGVAAPASLKVATPVGIALGTADSTTVGRFSVRYATASRWEDSIMVSSWQLPNNASDPSTTPLACPQPSSSENSAATDEDCLSMILYVPAIVAFSNAPALMWVHGGSNIVGSATGPGLDGAALADATGSIVAVVQYRLGALGFLSPSGEPNLAVKDLIVALQFLEKILPSFNGDTSKITIAGQSSGASLVRSLLAAPSVSSLFKSANLHSDPMDYSFLSTETFDTLNNFMISQLPCSASDTSCLAAMSTDDLVNLSLEVFSSASSLDAAAGAFMPMRPSVDGKLITSTLDATAPFPSQSKTIIVTTVQNEAGPTIYSTFTEALSVSDFDAVVEATFGSERAGILLASSFYSVSNSSNNSTTVDTRVQLEAMGTDQVWRCPSWTFARSWAASGGTVYVGKYGLGATYPDNSAIAFCTEGGVCHEDDIEIVFGTAANPTSAQSVLIQRDQARLKSFLAGGAPNTIGAATWSPVKGNNTNALVFGGSSDGTLAVVSACDPSFWGSQVQYDYQAFKN